MHRSAILLSVPNGGFYYLLAAGAKGDPELLETAAAYRTIGAKRTAEAFEKMLALFEGSRAPRDCDKRCEHFVSFPEEVRDALDREFWDAEKAEFEACLAGYIRANKTAFLHLK